MGAKVMSVVLGTCLLPGALFANSPVRLRRAAGEYLLAPVTLNGAGPFEFVVDTGTQTTLVDHGLVRQLGLRLDAEESFASLASESVARRVTVHEIAIGPKTLVNREILAADLGPMRRSGENIQGVLGLDVLGLENFLLSNAGKTLEFDLDGRLAPRVEGERVVLREAGGRRLVEVFLPGLPRALLLVPDSGCPRVVLFERAPGAFGRSLSAVRSELLARTLTGERRIPSARLNGFRVGSRAFDGLEVLVVRDPGVLEGRAEDGLLPTSLFREVWFDHEGSFLILNPKLAR